MRSRILLGLVVLVAALWVPLAAQAHNYLVSSNPAADSTITVVPEAFTVTTNEALLDLAGDGGGFAIQVTDEAGLYFGDGCGVVSGSTFSTGATLGEAGTYRFVWQVVSADAHTVSGEFAFTWAPAADAVISPGSPTPPVCGVPVVTETPTPTATATPEPTVEPADAIDDDATSASDPSAALWIGGAVLAVLVAGGITWLIVRRRASPEQDSPEQAAPEQD